MEPIWLEYAKKLQLISQAGITYSKDPHDIERFKQIGDISLDILHDYTNIDRKEINNLFLNETGYPTPKIDVRAAIFKNDDILLVKEKDDGLWSLPGGWADSDISLSENLIKEAKEEAGIDIMPKKIIGILDRKKYNSPPSPYGVYKIFVECSLISGEFKGNIETSESQFYSLDNLPPLSIGRNTKEQIELCFSAKEKKYYEPLFD